MRVNTLTPLVADSALGKVCLPVGMQLEVTFSQDWQHEVRTEDVLEAVCLLNNIELAERLKEAVCQKSN